MGKMAKRLLAAAVLLSAVFLAAGCTKKRAEITCLADLKEGEYTIGMPSDVGFEETAYKYCPQAKILYFDGVTYIEPLRNGRIDAYLYGEMLARPVAEKYRSEGFVILDESLGSFDIALGLSEETADKDFKEKVDACILRYKEDGTMAEMKNRWSSMNPVKAEIRLPEDPEYTLRVATVGTIKPYTFYEDGKLTGFDIELAERIAADLNCGIDWQVADFSAMLAGLSTGKYDMIASNLYKTKERAENFLYSESYMEEHIVLMTVREADDSGFNTLEDLNRAKSFAGVTGSTIHHIMNTYYPDVPVLEYATLMDAVLSVQNGKTDATMYDEPIIRHIISENPALKTLPENVFNEDYYFCTAKNAEGTALAEDFNDWLAETKKSGKLDELADFWVGSEIPEGRCDFSSLTGENGTLVLGADVTSRPGTFLYNGNPVGYPLELLYLYCKDRGLKADVQLIEFGAFPAAITSGKIDIFLSFISYTEERAENMTFTDSVYSGGVSVLVRNEDRSALGSFWSSLKESFEKTFIREDRWKQILSGLGVTLLITFGGFVLANLLGALFCRFNLSGNRALHVAADVYSRIMQGTPIVVVLMILYYVVFGKTRLSGIVVAILGFGLVSGAGLAQLFEGAVRSVDKGQTEAALALGFSDAEAFRGIVFPQAARNALPGYFSELIALLKSTSIVGYIAVIDLTKASDIIRASTYEAFFPLISIAVIYFVIINLLLSLMKKIRKNLEPKRTSIRRDVPSLTKLNSRQGCPLCRAERETYEKPETNSDPDSRMPSACGCSDDRLYEKESRDPQSCRFEKRSLHHRNAR